jgi:hypothetical protein
VRGIRSSLTEGTEQSWSEVGHARGLVIKDRRAVGDGTVGFAKRTTVLTAWDVDGWTAPRPGRRDANAGLLPTRLVAQFGRGTGGAVRRDHGLPVGVVL